MSEVLTWLQGQGAVLKPVLVGAPLTVAMFVMLLLGAMWKMFALLHVREIGGHKEQNTGLKEQNGALKEQNATLEQRLKLAQEHQQVLTGKVTALEKEVAELRAKIDTAGVSELGAIKKQVDALTLQVQGVRAANTAVSEALGSAYPAKYPIIYGQPSLRPKA